jgi:aminoglycoside 6'-N-acetyltransferase I
MPISYCAATVADAKEVTRLCGLLYDGVDMDEELAANREYLADPRMAMFLAVDGGRAVAFAHASIRGDYVDGTQDGDKGYLEAVYVEPEYRRRGIARELVNRCQYWAKGKGCKEFASDCELSNEDSYRFHIKIGFSEANRLICFTKKL